MRRALANKINSGMERVLGLRDYHEPKAEISIDELKRLSLPPTPMELLNNERQQYDQRVMEKLIIVQQILMTLPVKAKRRVMNNIVANKIREHLEGVRVEQIPERMLDWLNDLQIL